MTRSVLYYGVNLGDPRRWQFREVDARGLPALSWLRDGAEITPEDDVDDDSFIDQALAHLVRRTEPSGPVRPAHTFVRERYGVEFGTYAAAGDLAVFLATYVLRHDWDADPVVLEADWMTRAPQAGQWDALLDTALAVLEMTPTQAAPKWMMCTRVGD
ncbi:hypothetical protein ETD86_45815 [Nonomuraea turkmeniaca]|uniref:Uncharacterized protein n=1 Tax=Nonomuraea turkmeniaca TaxID=103838 RepID=A0A5S4EZ02_9ACTN|nr:hypothetical protein [Nonomuraea turkmeniaca]TMR08893.1 hypothetical protein ETD86_45815 [Nonomuraea turkmeniaca]